MYRSQHAYFDTSSLVKLIYSIVLHRRFNKPKPRILSILENKVLIVYTSRVIVNELFDKALQNLLESVNRQQHGWENIDIYTMRGYFIDEFELMRERDFLRIIEEDDTLKRQRKALESRPSRRVCYKDEVLDRVVSIIPEEDIDIVWSLLYAYDLLATVPRGTAPGISGGKLAFVTDDVNLRKFIENHIACKGCPCANRFVVRSYREFKQSLRELVK